MHKVRYCSYTRPLQVIPEKIKKNKLFLLLFILSWKIIFGQNINKDSIIEWNQNRKLTWSDFLDKPDDNIIADALTSYKIEVVPSNVIVDQYDRIQNYNELSVKANFYKYHSWYIENTKELLEHEQLHFDIAELYARKMRMEFMKMKNKNESRFESYLNCYKRLWKECRKLQQEYDFETNNGRIREENLKWINKITIELSKFDNYK